MAENESKKEEEKFEFTPEDEALGYISLDQARILAMRTARDAPGDYGRRFRNVPMAFELAEANETEDYYEVTLSFSPQGAFTGTQGQEQFFIEKEGDVAVCQVLSLPTAVGGRRFPFIPAAIGLVVVVIAVVIGVVLAIGGGETAASITPVPTISTPLSSATQTAESNPLPTAPSASDTGPPPAKTPTSTLETTAAPTPGPSPVSVSGTLPSVPVPAL